ncbi:MAG: 2Fe-2S iron-sulfur cluster binding domain-containing protein [Gammaproteobacteria bacterium]|nr:2Fe-2S iron-sulfur cluster binding domain-containing protein [Gammaproteobacteria bacterium]
MSHQLTIEPLGATIEVEDGQRMLDACLRAGIWLPYACNHGLCGTCKVQVMEGEIEHNEASQFALMDIERDERKTLACCATLASDVVIEADIEEEADAEHLPINDWSATVVRLEPLTPTIRGVFLQVDGELRFQPGQYVNLTLPGVSGPRAFSIASPPSAGGVIELNVRRVEGGAATCYIHDRLAVGDTLRFSAPLGRFFVRRSAPEPMLFLAGGSGLSSPRSMVLDLLERGDTRPITLIQGARNLAELYYREQFEALAATHPAFTYVPALSEPTPGDAWAGATGFVHEVAESHFEGRFEGMKAYLCGPPPMIDACLTSLIRGRLFEQHIYMESFLTAADGAVPARRSALFRKF